MAKESDQKESVPYEQLIMSAIYTQEAMINILEKKGLLTREEVLTEITHLQEESQ